MKKAKFALTAIVVFAAIGGAFALKARSSQGLYFGTTENGVSTTYLTGWRTTAISAGTTSYATIAPNSPVKLTHVTVGS